MNAFSAIPALKRSVVAVLATSAIWPTHGVNTAAELDRQFRQTIRAIYRTVSLLAVAVIAVSAVLQLAH
jgi:hypothetical protein